MSSFELACASTCSVLYHDGTPVTVRFPTLGFVFGSGFSSVLVLKGVVRVSFSVSSSRLPRDLNICGLCWDAWFCITYVKLLSLALVRWIPG